LAYQPPANSTFLSEKPATSNQQPASSTFLSEQTSTSHQPNEQAVECPNKDGSFTHLYRVRQQPLTGTAMKINQPLPVSWLWAQLQSKEATVIPDEPFTTGRSLCRHV
jgi:hypothetical protein